MSTDRTSRKILNAEIISGKTFLMKAIQYSPHPKFLSIASTMMYSGSEKTLIEITLVIIDITGCGYGKEN